MTTPPPDDQTRPADAASCGEVGTPAVAWRAPVLYPSLYTWYVFVAAIDVLFTALILRAGGHEVNVLADWILDQWNIHGLVVFKFLTVAVVLVICECVGRRRAELGAQLARWAVVISAFPAVVGGIHILRIAMGVTGHLPTPD